MELSLALLGALIGNNRGRFDMTWPRRVIQGTAGRVRHTMERLSPVEGHRALVGSIGHLPYCL